jgi:hypothetical protein
MDSLLRAAFPILIPALVALAGCSAKSATDPAEIARLQTRLTLADEPAGVQTVSEIRTAMLGEAPPNVLMLLEDDHDHADDHAADGDHDHASAEHSEHDAHDHATPSASAEVGGKPKDRHVKEMDVVMIGVVGGVPNPLEQTVGEFPFAKGRAMFFLADPTAVAELEEHGHQHAPGEECAFCAAHAADAKALIAAVKFSDDHGKLLAVDSRELFGLKAMDTVVVQGTARVVPGGILTVDATGLYLRR